MTDLLPWRDGMWSEYRLYRLTNSRVLFQPGGLARLAELAGFVQAMESLTLSPVEALTLGVDPAGCAKALDEAVSKLLWQLMEYGGDVEFAPDEGRALVRHPAFKFVVDDDRSGMGQFAFAAYRPVPLEELEAEAQEIWEKGERDSNGIRRGWTEVMEEVCRKHRVPHGDVAKTLESTRFYKSQAVLDRTAAIEATHHNDHHDGDSPWLCDVCNTDSLYSDRHTVVYTMSHNGLIVFRDIGTVNVSVSRHT